jgi:hypothetical protein
MHALLALTLMAAIGQSVALEPRDLIGSWQAQRELTMLELHPDFTYDRYFADVFDQGSWTFRKPNMLELFCTEKGRHRVADAYRITGFGQNVIYMHRAKGEADAWVKTNYSRHFPRLSR